MNDRAYLKIYAYNDNGELTDIKVVRINKDGKIKMEEAIGQPQPENITKDKPEYKEEDIKVEYVCPKCKCFKTLSKPCPNCGWV
jgi:hypothetical protein